VALGPLAADAMRQAQASYGKDADAYLKLFPAATDAEAEASAYAVAAARTAVGQRSWLKLEAQTGKNKTWLYLFSRVPPFPPGAHFLENATDKIGAYHAVDLIYVFDHLYLKDWPWQDADRRIADVMSRPCARPGPQNSLPSPRRTPGPRQSKGRHFR
jgi:para-nitrobenzyl esterase